MQIITKITWLLMPLLFACASQPSPRYDLTETDPGVFSDQALNDIMQWRGRAQSNSDEDVLSIRTQAIQEAAISVATQTALAVRMRFLQNRVSRQEDNLNDIFDFAAMQLGNVLPPVITEANDLVVLDSDDSMRIAGRTYKIQQQARFTSIAPTWRDYLLANHFKKPEKPHAALLPKTNDEIAIWREYVIKGWRIGVEQADDIMSINLSRLQRDWVGMVRYHLLFRSGQVSAPIVAKSNQGVTGNSEAMVLNDQILRITVKPMLELNSKKWKAIPKLPTVLARYE